MDFKKSLKKVKELSNPIIDSSALAAAAVGAWATNKFAEHTSTISQDVFLKWLEEFTKGTATKFDKAMDHVYNSTHVGGGNHRLFDHGHDLLGAWKAAKDAAPDDTFIEEVSGYASALWKDFTTVKGLPFDTIEKANFDGIAESLGKIGISKDYLYDLCSFDAAEVLGATVGVAGLVFQLKNDDLEKFSELLGSMGIISIVSANPIMGVLAVIVTAYAYFVKKKEIDGKFLAKGATIAAVSSAIVLGLGLPFLVEFIIVMVVTTQLRKQIFDNEQFFFMVRRHLSDLGDVVTPKTKIILNIIKDMVPLKTG